MAETGDMRDALAGGPATWEETDEPVPDGVEEEEELPLPVGTLAVVGLYLLVLVVAWLAVYLDFLGR